jgi:hydrogenase/urease accessory protein HupE
MIVEKKWFVILITLLSFGFFSPIASAHSNNSEGFSTINIEKTGIKYELKLDLLELGHATKLPMNQTQDANKLLSDNKPAIQNYVNSRIKLYLDSIPVEGEIKETSVAKVKNRPFAIINLAYPIEQAPENLIVNYNAIFEDSDPSHANFTKVNMNGKQQEFVFSYEVRELKVGEMSFINKAKQFLLLGLEHIFTGYDHIIFVISLLFGARNIRQILALVTAFTVAHSVTLVLATLQIVTLPGKFIESAIALSIVYVAFQNIFNQQSKHHPVIAFGFGLIHGFGFAGILSEMRLDGQHLATSLLFFNIGIELGQILIVSLVFPALLFVQKKWNVKWLVPGISTGALAFGLVWFFQRAF